MSAASLDGATAIVTGASGGFGRAIAASLASAGAHVVGVGRNVERMRPLQAELGAAFTAAIGDACDPTFVAELIDAHAPSLVILNAGASTHNRPIQQQTWETFSRNWDVDTKHVFHWTREALLRPLRAGSIVIAVSSGAALRGSPLSGGYAGAKATIGFIAEYAAGEADRAGLGIRFLSLLPDLTPATPLGAAAVAAYADRAGVDRDVFVAGRGVALAPSQVGEAIIGLIASTDARGAFTIGSNGVAPPAAR